MKAMLFLPPLFFIHAIEAQLLGCANGGVGPCVARQCPAGGITCIDTATGEICCENTKIIPPTTTASATTTAPCVDKLNPKTGRSDCPNMAYLCNNAVYYSVMTEQCPKTCNRCNGGLTTCQDLVDPRTGVSNCAQMSSYCKNPVYMTLMRQQCPKTCGYCI